MLLQECGLRKVPNWYRNLDLSTGPTWFMDLALNMLCIKSSREYLTEIWWWAGFYHLRVLWTPWHWEERIKTPKREKKWERNKSQRPQIWAFPARSGTDNHLILYIKAKTHWKGTSVHRDQHPAGYMRQNRPPPTHTWAQQPSRGCQMVLTSTWKRRGWHLWRMLQKLTPENHPPNNRLIPSRRVSEARKFASRWDWAILGCLMRSGKAEASRVRGKLADECSDGERDVQNFVSGLFHWTETRFRPFFPQKNSTSIPQSYTHTHTDVTNGKRKHLRN